MTHSFPTRRSSDLLDDSIWRKKIIGKQDVDIAKLIGALNLGDWLNQGLKYMHGDTCPFCQQKTITDSFRAKVAEYFDDSFTSRSEEHTSELQSLMRISYAVFCLKKKKKQKI